MQHRAIEEIASFHRFKESIVGLPPLSVSLVFPYGLLALVTTELLESWEVLGSVPIGLSPFVCFPGLCHPISLPMFAFQTLRRLSCNSKFVIGGLSSFPPPLVVLNLNPVGMLLVLIKPDQDQLLLSLPMLLRSIPQPP